MTHDLWAGLNAKMIEFLDSVVAARSWSTSRSPRACRSRSSPVKRAISTQPVVKPIKITAPNSVFALGSALSPSNDGLSRRSTAPTLSPWT